MRRHRWITGLLMLLLAMSACADKIVDSTPSILDEQIEDPQIDNNMRARFNEIQSQVFDQSCALSGCHIPGIVSPDLSTGQAYNNMVNKASSRTLDLIEPGSADQSYLFLKLLGGNGISGSRMPRNAAPLSQVKIDSIRAWIDAGALNN